MRVESSRITPRKVTKELLTSPQTTQIIAKPVDMYVKPNLNFEGSSNGVRNAKLLEGLVGNTVRVAGMYYKENAEQDYLKGQQDATARKQMDTDYDGGFLHSKESYENGYRGMEDEARAIGFESDYLEQLKLNNYYLDAPDPKAMQDELYTNLYQNHFSQEYLQSNGRDGRLTENGLLRIKAALLKGEEQFNEASLEKQKTDFVNSANVIVMDAVDKGLANGSLTAKGLSDYSQSIYEENLLSNGESITKAEYNHLMLDNLGSKVITLVRAGKVSEANSLFDAIKDMGDSDGKFWDRVTKTDAKTGEQDFGYRRSIIGIENELAKEEKAIKEAQEEARRQQEDAILRSTALAASLSYNEMDPLKRFEMIARSRDALQKGVAAGIVSSTHAKTWLDMMDSQFQNGGFPDKTNGNYLAAAETYVNNPNANAEDFAAMFKTGLNPRDFTKYLGQLYDNKEKIAKVGDSSYKEARTEGKRQLELMMNNLLGGAYRDVTRLTGEDAALIQAGDREMDKFILEFIRDNDRVPSIIELMNKTDEMYSKMNKLVKKGGNSAAATNRFNTSGNGNASTSGANTDIFSYGD